MELHSRWGLIESHWVTTIISYGKFSLLIYFRGCLEQRNLDTAKSLVPYGFVLNKHLNNKI